MFYATKGATTATVIDNSTDTRALAISNVLYRHQHALRLAGFQSLGRGFLAVGRQTPTTAQISASSLGRGTLPTSSTTPTRVIPSSASVNGGNTGSIDLTAGLANGVNNSRIGKFVYLSPEQFFFASSNVAICRR